MSSVGGAEPRFTAPEKGPGRFRSSAAAPHDRFLPARPRAGAVRFGLLSRDPQERRTLAFSGPGPGKRLLPVAGLRHFLSSQAFGWWVLTRFQHAHREVLFLFGAHIPRPRHDVRPQRLQGEAAKARRRPAVPPRCPRGLEA